MAGKLSSGTSGMTASNPSLEPRYKAAAQASRINGGKYSSFDIDLPKPDRERRLLTLSSSRCSERGIGVGDAPEHQCSDRSEDHGSP